MEYFKIWHQRTAKQKFQPWSASVIGTGCHEQVSESDNGFREGGSLEEIHLRLHLLFPLPNLSSLSLSLCLSVHILFILNMKMRMLLRKLGNITLHKLAHFLHNHLEIPNCLYANYCSEWAHL